MNKTVLLFLSILFCFSLSSIGQVIEDFNYTSGESLETQSGGSLWKGKWTKVGGDDNLTITEGGITARQIGIKTSDNHLTLNQTAGSTGERYFRSIANPILDDGSSFYVSFFMKTTWEGDAAANGSVNLVMLADSATLAATGPGGQLVQFGRVYNTNMLGILKGGTHDKAIGTDASKGNFVVVKVFMSGDDGNEKFYMFVNPDISAEPDTANAVLKSQKFNLNDGFNAIALKIEGGKALTGDIDDIKIGSSYSEIVPTTYTSVAAPATEKFNYAEASSIVDASSVENGWGSAWQTLSGDAPLVALEGISNTSILKATSSNKISVTFDGTKRRFTRPLSAKFEDDGSTYYLSFSTKSTGGTNPVSYLMLADENYAASGPGGQLVQIGKIYNGDKIGLGVASTFVASEAMADEAHFIVAKIMTSGDDQGDSVALFIDPDLSVEPVEASVGKLFGATLNNGFNAIGIKVEGDAGNTLTAEYDDIMIGFDYASVIPNDLVDITPPSIIAVDRFNYTAEEKLTDKGEATNGWSSQWIPSAEGDSSIIRNRGLRNETNLLLTKGPICEVYCASAASRYVRYFEKPIVQADGGFWFSASMAVSGKESGAVGSFILIDSSEVGDTEQQITIGKKYGNMNLFATGSGAGGGTETGETFTEGEAKWVVGYMSPNADNWELDLWVNPDHSALPIEADAQIQNKIYSSADIHGIMVRSEGGSGLSFIIDDIYFGRQFENVVPADFITMPAMPSGAIESFNYTELNDSIKGKNGGSGFAGEYKILSGSNQPVIDEGLENYYLLKKTKEPSLNFPLSSKARIIRELDGEYGDYGRSFWVGWFQKNYGTDGNVANLVIADINTFAATGNAGFLVQVGKSYDGTIKMVGNGAAVAEGVAWDTTHFYALYIETNGTSEADKLYLFVDPDLSQEPDIANANAMITKDLSTWNSIGFKVEGPDGLTASFDELRIGNSYTDIIATDLSDLEEPAQPVPAIELFDYTAGEDLEAKEGGEGWNSAWTKNEGTISIAETSIESDKVEPSGNKAGFDQDNNVINYTREFTDVFGTTTSSVWMSFLMDVSQKSVGNEAWVNLLSNDDQVFGIGGSAGINKLSTCYNNKTVTTSDTEYDVTGISWVVVRLDINGTEEADQAVVWVNPMADAIPDDADALFSMNDININTGFNKLQLTASGIQTLSMFFDEFRIGFSFRDVSNKFGSDDPDLIAYEAFNYEADSDIVGAGGINAFWDGKWTVVGDISNNTAKVKSSSMEFGDIATEGNKLEFNYTEDNTQIVVVRKLAFPLENDGDSYWISFMYDPYDGDALNNVANLSLSNTEITQKDGQRLGIGRIYGTGSVGVITPPNNESKITEYEDVDFRWLVAKVQTTANENPDTLWLWVNHDPNTEPDTAFADLRFETPFLKEGINSIMIKTAGAGGGQTPFGTNWDELKLARTWNSLVKIDTSSSSDISLSELNLDMEIYPNPAREFVNIKYQMKESASIKTLIYDISGKLIFKNQSAELSPGNYSLIWNGTSQNGENVENGLYIIQVTNGKQTITKKLIFFK